MQKNVVEALSTLKERPIFSTFYERVTLSNQLKYLYLDQPQPIRFGKILGEFLSRVSKPFDKDDLMVGRLSVKELTESEEQEYKKFLTDPDGIYKNVFFGHGHCSFDWENLISSGIEGVMAQIEARKSRESAKDKLDYLEGMALTLTAISGYILAYAEIAKKAGREDLYVQLNKIATGKPETFYEALQLAWIVTFINCSFITGNPTLTVGRLDRLLYPYFDADLKAGRLTEEQAKAIITDYYCKHNLNMGRGEHQTGNDKNSTTFSRILNFDAPQYLMLAGTDEQGEGVVNRLTELFLECVVPEFKNPVIILHYFKDMDKKYPYAWRLVSGNALKSASMIIYNDDDVKNALREVGLPEDVVNGYVHYGCNWLGLGINSHVVYMGPYASKMCQSLGKEAYEDAGYDMDKLRCNPKGGLPAEFLDVMDELVTSGQPIDSIEPFFDKFISNFDKFVANRLKKLKKEFETRFLCPTAILIFGDSFNRYTIENVGCSGSSGVKWHFDSQGLQGFATTVDCFLAVDELCFDKKLTTVKELYEATKNDFVSYEKLLALTKKAEKFGNDTKKANEFAKRLLNGLVDAIIKHDKQYINEGFVLLPTIQSDTWHFKYGAKLGATPDGRRAFTPYSQNANPVSGVKKNGLTGMLNSLNQLPFNRLVSGALQFDVEPKAFSGEEGLTLFSSVLAEYFGKGGLNAQVSSVNVEELEDAQLNPDAHKDLTVRVTGYSGIFVDVPKPLQDDIIDRMR